MSRASFEILGFHTEVRCDPPELLAAFEAVYERAVRGCGGSSDLSYSVSRQQPGNGFLLSRTGGGRITAADVGDLLQAFDEAIRIELQKLRPDLYFIHAGALCLEDRALLLVGEPGSGKSTACWGLSHLGFSFLSDEMAPIELGSLVVLPYPRALRLKDPLPPGFPLPAKRLTTPAATHIPTAELPGGVRRRPAPLAAIFFVSYLPEAAEPALHRVTAAEASARLYANTLNALAHEADGLDGAIRIAANVPCFVLTAADLAATCSLIEATIEEISAA